MDPIPERERYICGPEITADGKQYPPKMREGKAGGGKSAQQSSGLASVSGNPGVDSSFDGIPQAKE
jgi:hypothetical protein